MTVEVKKTKERYAIVDRIGSGSMATVYRAYDQSLQRMIALKILHDHLNTQSELRQRFEQEGKLAARIDHPNVVRIYDIGINTQNQMFIVSELVEGRSLTLALRQYMNRMQPFLNPILAALVAHDIARGMDAAHRHSVIHRDLKPDNVLLSNAGDVKLTDFGVARPFDSAMTQAGQFIGSLSYASPEQVQGKKVDARSDIFSFGVILFELLTGQLPFRSTNPADLAFKITQANVPPLNQIRSSIPMELEALVRKCLRANPFERTPNASDIVRELTQFLVRNEVQTLPQFIRDGFENPALFASTKLRASFSNPEFQEQTEQKNEVETTKNSIIKSLTDQKSNPSEKIHLARSNRKFAQKVYVRNQVPTNQQKNNKNSSMFFFSLLLLLFIASMLVLVFIKPSEFQETLHHFKNSWLLSRTEENGTQIAQPPEPIDEKQTSSPTLQQQKFLIPMNAVITPGPTETPIPTPTTRQTNTESSQKPRPNQEPSVQVKPSLKAPVSPHAASKKAAVIPKPPREVGKTRQLTASTNRTEKEPPMASTPVKKSSLLIQTNPGSRTIDVIRGNKREFLGLSARTNSSRLFSALEPGPIILRIPAEEVDGVRFEGFERRFNLLPGQQLSVPIINTRKLANVTILCTTDVRIIKVNKRTINHRGGPITLEVPISSVLEIETIQAQGQRFTNRFEIKIDNQRVTCPESE